MIKNFILSIAIILLTQGCACYKPVFKYNMPKNIKTEKELIEEYGKAIKVLKHNDLIERRKP